MRTTVTLDPDAEQLVRRQMSERGLSFKQALNQLIRTGAQGQGEGAPFHTQTAAMGVSQINLDRALQVAAELEDDELVRKMRSGK